MDCPPLHPTHNPLLFARHVRIESSPLAAAVLWACPLAMAHWGKDFPEVLLALHPALAEYKRAWAPDCPSVRVVSSLARAAAISYSQPLCTALPTLA